MSPAAQIASRYLAAFSSQPAWVVVAALLLLASLVSLLWPALSWPAGAWPSRPWPSRWSSGGRRSTLRSVLLASCVVGAAAWALKLAWIADDAYISFRYARNWGSGLGPVYNAGERVEGYTNFLWVALLTPFEVLGLPVPLLSIGLTLSCQAAALLLVARLLRRAWGQEPPPLLPIAVLLLGLNYVFASYGTSGLETMLGALLVLVAIERASAGRPLLAGLAGILATMTHPDHSLFYVALALALLWGEGRFRNLVRFGIPFVVLYLPYFFWRWSYYGDFFPNTYYAKNASLTYFLQGGRYLVISGIGTGLWLALPLAVYGVWRFRRQLIARFCLFAAPLFLLYVAKIGGDFMLGRLLCPLLPPVFVLAELGLRDLARRPRWAPRGLAVAGLAGLCTTIVPNPIIKSREKYLHLADERTFYPVTGYFPLEIGYGQSRRARELNDAFGPLSRAPVLSLGAIGIMGYQTSVRIVDNLGLVNRSLAHWKNRRRGRPGHEKIIGPGMLLESGAHLSTVPAYPGSYQGPGRMRVAGFDLHTVRYDTEIFGELSGAGYRIPTVLAYVDAYQPPVGPGYETRLDCDLWHLEHLYFRHNPDQARRRRIVERVRSRHPAWSGYEAFLLGEPAPGADDWQRVAGLSFDESEGLRATGTAFVDNPAHGERIGQHSMHGARGGFVNSYTEVDGDEARGTLTSEPFPIVGEVITLQVAGGRFPREEYVELLVDGQRWFSSTGCNSGILGRRVWVTRDLIGSSARVRVVDRHQAGWGHVIVDELVQWRRGSAGSGEPASPASGSR